MLIALPLNSLGMLDVGGCFGIDDSKLTDSSACKSAHTSSRSPLSRAEAQASPALSARNFVTGIVYLVTCPFTDRSLLIGKM